MMPLKKRNRILLVSLLTLIVLVFSVVFLKPSFLNKFLTGWRDGLPTRAQKGGYVIAKNASETFAMEVPAAWKVIDYPDSEGYLSLLTVQSSDFKVKSLGDDPYGLLGSTLLSGAKLDISVIRSPEEFVPKPTNEITHEEIYKIADTRATYYSYNDPGIADAEFHEVRFAKKGNVYYIKMTFNPKSFKDGEKIFKYILSTLVIK